jgi:hypothetical protein
MQFVPDQVRQLPGGIPGNFKFSKVYYTADLRKILDEEARAKTLGDAALDEWRKGLLDAGKALMSDSARWEKWELQMRPGTDLAHMLREYDPSSFPRYFGKVQSRSAGLNGLQLPLAANGKHSSFRGLASFIISPVSTFFRKTFPLFFGLPAAEFT